MIRRLCVIHYPTFGGPQNQALRLSEPLRQRGVETTVVLPAEPGNSVERLRAAGIDVVELPLSRLRAERSIQAQIRTARAFRGDVGRLRGVIRNRKIDLVEIPGLVNLQGGVAAQRERVPITWQLVDTRAPAPVRRVLGPLVGRMAASVMTTGYAVARAHPGIPGLGPRLVPFFPPVDTSVFSPSPARRLQARAELGIPPDATVVGTIANVTPQKGLEYLVDATLDVRRTSCPDVWLVIVGRSMDTHADYEHFVRDRALQLSADRRFVLLDGGARVHELVQTFDVFVMPAIPRSEGISTAVLEAMACAIPIVTTDVGGLREAVTDGIDGLVVPPLNPHALGRAIAKVVTDDALRSRMARAARATAERDFGISSCVEAHVRAFEIALGRTI